MYSSSRRFEQHDVVGPLFHLDAAVLLEPAPGADPAHHDGVHAQRRPGPARAHGGSRILQVIEYTHLRVKEHVNKYEGVRTGHL